MKTFCDAAYWYTCLLSFWTEFGPELPNGRPDPAFDYLVNSYVAFNQTQLMWQKTIGSDNMKFCFLK